MKEFSISVDLGGLVQMSALYREGAFRELAAAVARAADVGRERWQRAAHAAPLWEGERNAYMASIQTRQITPYHWEIYSDYRYSEDIESGRPPYDLKRMLDTSPKVRRTKDGRRFLVIPFRHNTPGNTAHARAMPKSVYAEAKALAPSSITGHGERPVGQVMSLSPKHGMRPAADQSPFLSDPKTKSAYMVRKREYQWGGRLAAGTAPKLRTEHKSDPYAGMVKMKNATGGSSYVTFRVMIEGSSGWIIPAKPGLWIARAVADSLRSQADASFPAALEMDLKSAS